MKSTKKPIAISATAPRITSGKIITAIALTATVLFLCSFSSCGGGSGHLCGAYGHPKNTNHEHVGQ